MRKEILCIPERRVRELGRQPSRIAMRKALHTNLCFQVVEGQDEIQPELVTLQPFIIVKFPICGGTQGI
jgi:hypothetical protein